MTGFNQAELSRRLGNVVRTGTIFATDYSGKIPLCRVRIGDDKDRIETGWLPMSAQRAGGVSVWSPFEAGEQVTVLSPMGDFAQGVVMGAINQDAAAAQGNSADVCSITFSDGAVIHYNRKDHQLKMILPDGAKTTLISKGGISIEGDVEVTGNIKASGDITDHTRSMQADRDIYNGHTHSDPQGGSVPATGQRQ